MLDYANRYRAEVSVSIDATIPEPGDGQVQEPEPGFSEERALAVTGIVRAVTFVAPGLLAPDSDAYMEDELHRMRLVANWNFGNPAVADETARIANNAEALRGVTYLKDLTVLASSPTKAPTLQSQRFISQKPARQHQPAPDSNY